MKRTTKESVLVKFKNLGGGSFHATIAGKIKIIKPNEVFSAYPEDISVSFRDVVVPVEGNSTKEIQGKDTPDIPDVPVAEVVFTLKKKGGAYYNVEDANGKVMNEKGLVKVDAEALIKSLS